MLMVLLSRGCSLKAKTAINEYSYNGEEAYIAFRGSLLHTKNRDFDLQNKKKRDSTDSIRFNFE